MLVGRDLSSASPYSVKAKLAAGDLIAHPTFGVGVVTAITDVHKAKVFFEDGERMLVCNRD